MEQMHVELHHVPVQLWWSMEMNQLKIPISGRIIQGSSISRDY